MSKLWGRSVPSFDLCNLPMILPGRGSMGVSPDRKVVMVSNLHTGFDFYHLNDNWQDGSVSHHWTGVRVPVEFINWQCCTRGKYLRGGSYLGLYDPCHHYIEDNLLTYNRRPLVCYHHCCIYPLCLSFFSALPASSRHTMQAALMGPNSC